MLFFSSFGVICLQLLPSTLSDETSMDNEQCAHYIQDTKCVLSHRRWKEVLFGKVVVFAREIFRATPTLLKFKGHSWVLLLSGAKKWWKMCTMIDSCGYSRQLLTILV